MQLGQAYEQLSEPQFALDALNDGARLSGGNSKPLALRGHVFARNARAGSGRGGTPAGNYAITVTGTSGSTQHSETVRFRVQ